MADYQAFFSSSAVSQESTVAWLLCVTTSCNIIGLSVPIATRLPFN